MPLDLFTSDRSIDNPLTLHDYACGLKKRLQLAYLIASKNHLIKTKKQKVYYDRTAKAKPFKENDLVWLSDKAKKKGVNKKLQPRWKGPYVITGVINELNYYIKHINTKRTTLVHRNRLTKCHARIGDEVIDQLGTNFSKDGSKVSSNVNLKQNLVRPLKRSKTSKKPGRKPKSQSNQKKNENYKEKETEVIVREIGKRVVKPVKRLNM